MPQYIAAPNLKTCKAGGGIQETILTNMASDIRMNMSVAESERKTIDEKLSCPTNIAIGELLLATNPFLAAIQYPAKAATTSTHKRIKAQV